MASSDPDAFIQSADYASYTTIDTNQHDSINTLEPISDSFWDIGNYRNVTRRIDYTVKLCDDLTKLISERAEIEERYSQRLINWSKKWSSYINKGPEYGTLKETWHAGLLEATQTANLHMAMKTSLTSQVEESVKQWKKENFHRSLVGWKETKRVEQAFAKAQKPWTHLYNRVVRSKKSYYNICRNYFDLNQKIEETETSSSDYSLTKLQKDKDRFNRLETQMYRAQHKYRQRLDELHNYRDQYMIDMTREYDLWEEFEKTRITFFISAFKEFASALNVSKFSNLSKINEDFKNTINQTSPQDDLLWFSQHYGKEMPKVFPQFEEYAGSHQPILASEERVPSYLSEKSNFILSHNLSGNNVQGYSEHRQPATLVSTSYRDKEQIDIDLDRFGVAPETSKTYTIMESEEKLPTTTTNTPNSATIITNTSTKRNEVPMETDSWEPPIGSTGYGRPMRALYDFEAEEDDDLPFREGDILQVYGNAKDGWIQATLNGDVGYAPLEYLENS